jgi:hypothetical protein
MTDLGGGYSMRRGGIDDITGVYSRPNTHRTPPLTDNQRVQKVLELDRERYWSTAFSFAHYLGPLALGKRIPYDLELHRVPYAGAGRHRFYQGWKIAEGKASSSSQADGYSGLRDMSRTTHWGVALDGTGGLSVYSDTDREDVVSGDRAMRLSSSLSDEEYQEFRGVSNVGVVSYPDKTLRGPISVLVEKLAEFGHKNRIPVDPFLSM